MKNTNPSRKVYVVFIAALLFLSLAAATGYSADSCNDQKIGIVGASNTVESSSSWSGILKSKCSGSQFFIEAKSGYSPVQQASELLQKVLANKPALVIISPSGNGIEQDSAHLAAVKDMAKKAKAAGAKVAVLSITPRKYYCYCGAESCGSSASKESWEKSSCTSKWSDSIQKKVDAFNSDLLKNKLSSSDIDYVVDVYTPLGSSSDKDVCGYCGADGGHLTKTGGEKVSDAVVSAVFKGVQPAAAATATRTGCGKSIAAVGDSITAKSSYVVDLGKLCGSSTTIKNDDGDPKTTQTISEVRAGVPGDTFAFEGKTTKQMKDDFGTVLLTNPDTVIILGGTNDIFGSWESIKTHLIDMYKMAKAKGVKVVAVTIPPYKDSKTRKDTTLSTIKSLNKWIMTESAADVKVNIYDSLVLKGTDDADPSLFAADLTHPNAKGKAVMAQKIYDALTLAGAPSAAAAPTTTVTGVPTTVLPKTLYDFVINSSAGITTIVGIARQNIAIGINKTVPSVSPGALCQPITADRSYDLDWLKQTYGRTQLEVESQLVYVKFMGQDVRVHRLISPALGCVENEIKQCTQGKDYSYDYIDSYSWQFTSEGLLSASAFGIAIDINIARNPNSQDGKLTTDIPNCTVDAFKRYGFKWGGDYKTGKAPAHFEFMADPGMIVVQQQITCPAGTTLVTVPAGSSEAVTATTQTSASASGTSSVKVSSSSTPDSLAGNSDFVWPIQESSSSWNRVVYCYGSKYTGGSTAYHDGVDVGVAKGTPVVAIADGIIVRSCSVPDECRNCNPNQCRAGTRGDCCKKCGTVSSLPCGGMGSNVLIRHADNLYSHYLHFDTVSVGIANGVNVKKGQQIGTVGNTGWSGGNHLHFAIYNKWPRTMSGDPNYKTTSGNPLCFFPDSILKKLNIVSGNCIKLYGGTGQLLVSTQPQIAEDCKKADLSALAKLTPTPATSLPQSIQPAKGSLVQVCRPVAKAAGPMTTEPLGQETIVKCATGDCIAQMADYYRQKYSKFPYVWGGESPYDPAKTLALTKDKNSFFYGVSAPLTQPEGNTDRSGKPTEPGFDCSGFVWWVYKHAGIPGFSVRQGATAQRNYGDKYGTVVACNPTGADIKRLGQPGDLIFWGRASSGTAVGNSGCEFSKVNPHVAIYIGNGQKIESAGSRPESQLPTDIDWNNYFSTYPGIKSKTRYGGLSKTSVSSTYRYDSLVRYKPASGATAVAFNAQEFESGAAAATTAVT